MGLYPEGGLFFWEGGLVSGMKKMSRNKLMTKRTFFVLFLFIPLQDQIQNSN